MKQSLAEGKLNVVSAASFVLASHNDTAEPAGVRPAGSVAVAPEVAIQSKVLRTICQCPALARAIL